jgi:topoisomerase (DNA) II binding protein 1
MNQRPEVVDWVRDGGGVMVDDIQSTAVDFIIECHGQNSLPCDFSHSTVVSTQWIRSCLEVHASVLEVTLLHYSFEVLDYIPVLI